MPRRLSLPARRTVPLAAAVVVLLGALSLTACKDNDEPAREAPRETAAAAATQQPATTGAPTAAAEAPPSATEAAAAGEVRTVTLPQLSFDVPTGWVENPPSSSMRAAEFILPSPVDGTADAELTVFRFAGGAGGVQANITRWLDQMQAPDGSAVEAGIQPREQNGLTVTTLDVTGTYIAQVRPGAPQRYNEPGWRLVGIIVEGSGDPYYLKLVGPQATVEAWQAGIDAFITSLRPAP